MWPLERTIVIVSKATSCCRLYNPNVVYVGMCCIGCTGFVWISLDLSLVWRIWWSIWQHSWTTLPAIVLQHIHPLDVLINALMRRLFRRNYEDAKGSITDSCSWASKSYVCCFFLLLHNMLLCCHPKLLSLSFAISLQVVGAKASKARTVQLDAIRIQWPDDSLTWVEDFVTCVITFLIDGSRRKREPLDLYLWTDPCKVRVG